MAPTCDLSIAWVEAFFLFLGAAVLVYVNYTLRSLLPNLSHPWMRRLGWQRSFSFFAVPLIPFWSATIGFMLLPAVLSMAAFQIERLWLVEALGREYHDLVRTAAARSSRRFAIICNLAAGLLAAAAASALWLVNPDPGRDWGYWFAAGLGVYAIFNAYERSRAASRFSTRSGSTGAT